MRIEFYYDDSICVKCKSEIVCIKNIKYIVVNAENCKDYREKEAVNEKNN